LTENSNRSDAMYLSAVGQDSHRFEDESSKKPLWLGGIIIPGSPGLLGNSDADVVLHAITNAISGISCVNILGKISDDLCLNKGIADSKVYLQEALKTLDTYSVVHVSVSIEARKPHLSSHIPAMRLSIANVLQISENHVGITATTGEGLTSFGKGEGIQAFVIITVKETGVTS
jgi:2-C-methyl-D-erythritol 2,4-cyclodiphosphate synthase